MATQAVEGPRLRKLRQVVAKALSQSQKDFEGKQQSLRNCFDKVDDGRLLSLISGWSSQVVEGISRNFELEFDEICRKNKLCEKLNALDHLYDAQPKSLTTGFRRPETMTQKPIDRVRAVVAGVKATELDLLRSQLQHIEKENMELEEKVTTMTKSIDESHKAISSKLETMMGAEKLCLETFPGL